MMCISKKC